MAVTKFPNGVSSYGMPVLPFSTTGNVFFVDSTGGVNDASGGRGKDPSEPFATWDYAYNQCAANNGDVIILMENHAETIAASGGVTMDLAGVKTIGLGVGSNRPTITFATSTAADIDVSAADNLIQNVVFVCNIANQVAMLTVANGGDGLVVKDCEFLEGSATGLNFITLGDADDVVIANCRFFAPTAGNYNEAVLINAALDRLVIEGCYIRGDFDEASIHNPTGNVATNLLIKDCVVENLQSGIHAIELISACTGALVDCQLSGNTLGTILDPGSCRIHNVTESAAIDTPGVTSPVTITDSAANILGADNNNNIFASTNVVANADGSIIERLENIQSELSTAGIASFPSGAAAANTVSIAEVLRYLQENVITGSGTVLPADSSLWGAIAGASGIATWPGGAAPAANVSLAEVVQFIYNALAGTVGLATFPSGVAAANDVNLAEVLRYTQENIILGSGTALPNNCSLYGVLAGATGIPTFPSGAAPANDVSIAEVLRDVWDVLRNGTGGSEPASNKSIVDYLGPGSDTFFVPGLGYMIEKTGGAIAADDDLFTVTGKCLINLVHGEVTTLVAGGTPTIKLNTKTGNIDICAATVITGDAQGTLYMVSGDQDDTLNGTDTPTVSHAQLGDADGLMPFIVDSDVIESTVGGAGTAGAIKWVVYYLPLEASASIVAAA